MEQGVPLLALLARFVSQICIPSQDTPVRCSNITNMSISLLPTSFVFLAVRKRSLSSPRGNITFAATRARRSISTIGSFDESHSRPIGDIHPSHWCRTAASEKRKSVLLSSELADGLCLSGINQPSECLRWRSADVGGSICPLLPRSEHDYRTTFQLACLLRVRKLLTRNPRCDFLNRHHSTVRPSHEAVHRRCLGRDRTWAGSQSSLHGSFRQQ
jgi:hypothetical protein